MSRYFNEKQNRTLIGNWFGYKSMGYKLLLIKAINEEGNVKIQYVLEKDRHIESVDAIVPENGTLPTVTTVFLEGEQMQKEIADSYPIKFHLPEDNEQEQLEGLLVEWGPFHPFLQEPVLVRFLLKDEIIEKASVETGYNHRKVEALCIGKKIPDVLEMLERISSVSGFSIGLAFLHGVEEINKINVPERANILRLIFNEMSFLKANLYSLSHITTCLGLLSDNSAISELIRLFNEAVSLIACDSQLKGILVPGGISRNISKEVLLQVNAILQEIVHELTAIRKRWNATQAIIKRLNTIGKIDRNTAKVMTGRIPRSAGYIEDTRRLSKLPYTTLSYKIPRANESNCFTRTMLMFDDSLLSLSIIDQAIEKLPRGDVKAAINLKNKGQMLIREPEAFGELVIYVSINDEIVKDIRLRNASSINFPFLCDFLKGAEINDAPLIITSFDLDFSGMEK